MTITRIILLSMFAALPALAQNTPGGGTLQVAVDPSGACSVASLMQYNYVNGNLWGCKNGTWTQTGGGGGSMTWPTTPGITACTGTPCTAWGTSLTAPTGALVGTTDTQSLTGKTVDGVTPTVFGFLDPTSSVQAQLDGKVPITRTVNGHALSGNVVVSASDLSTGTLPHAQLPTLVSGDIPNNAANTSGTSSNVSGTPALPNGTTASTQSQADNSTKLATTAYADTLGATKAGSNAATTVNGQTCTLGSSCTIPLSAVNPQTATYQVLAADFSSYKTITVASGTFTITLVASGSQPAAGQYIRVINYGSGVVTIARSGQNINGGTASLSLAAGSATAPTWAFVTSDGTNYFGAMAGGAAAVTSSNITSGTYASLPGTCAHSATASDWYYPTDSYYTFGCTATNTFSPFRDGNQLTLPTAASTWTLVNGSSGSATKADSKGAVLLSTTSSVIGLEAALKAVPAAPYTKTIAVKMSVFLANAINTVGLCGVVWTNGTATSNAYQIAGLYLQNGASSAFNTSTYNLAFVSHGTSFAWAGNTYDTLENSSVSGNVLYFQLADDNANRTVKVSNDGVNFSQIYSGVRTSPFTPTNYGIGCGMAQGTGATPWSVTMLSDN